jgi:hypothetical protein
MIGAGNYRSFTDGQVARAQGLRPISTERKLRAMSRSEIKPFATGPGCHMTAATSIPGLAFAGLFQRGAAGRNKVSGEALAQIRLDIARFLIQCPS